MEENIMLLTDITRIIRVLLGAFEEVASQDELTQRRIDQIGQVIGAVEDVAETEEQPDATVAEKRVEEAHDIIHRIAAILAMEEGREGGGGDETGTGNDESGNDEAGNDGNGGEGQNDDALREEIWNGKLDGETIELKEDEEE
jgi:hypothetical protein